MQSVSSRIWTRVAVSISYDDNYYTTGTSIQIISLNSAYKLERDWIVCIPLIFIPAHVFQVICIKFIICVPKRIQKWGLD